ERALHAPGQDQSMQDQASLNGLSQTDFVCKQNTRRQARRHFGRDIDLMRNQFDPAADETAHLGFADAMLYLERLNAQIEHWRRIELAERQSLFRFGEADRVTEVAFAEFPVSVAVKDKPGAFDDGVDYQRFLVPVSDGISGPEADPAQRSIR